jgi:hypothetical protein
MGNVLFAASEEIIYTQHVFSARDQAIAKMRAEEAGTAGD